MTAVLSVLVAVFGCIAIAAADTDADVPTVYVSDYGDDSSGDGSESSPYATLKKAVESIDSSGMVKFLTGFTMYDEDLVMIPKGKIITLDLNEKKGVPETGYSSKERYIVNHGTLIVTGNGIIDLNDQAGYYGFIKNYGTLKVENGTFNGDRDSNASLFRNCNGGTATFEDGTYTGSATIINSEAGSTTYVNGGYFSNDLYPALDVNGFTEISGGTFTSESCTTCNKGQFGYCVRTGLNDNDAHLLIKQAEGKELSITGVQGALAIIGGKADIYDGKFTTKQCDNDHDAAHYACYVAGESYQTSATIYGGTFTSYDKPALYIGNSNAPPDSGKGESSVVNVKGGEFSVSNSDPGVKPLSVQNAGNAVGAASITGGSFKGMTQDDLEEYLPDGYEVDSNGQIDESANVSFVAEINGTKYTTLSEAVSNAFAGDTIKLISTVNETEPLVIASDITIDLNGISHSVASFTVNTDAELTIQDTVGTGILSTGGVTVNGTFTILSGTMKQIQTSAANYITSLNGTINLNGGMINGVSTTSGAPVKIERGTLNVGGTTISECSGYFGAIYASDSTVKFTNGNITSNSSQRGAMGYNSMVYLADCKTTVEGITISGNIQGYSIMAYWTKAGGSFTMTGGTLSDGSRMALYLTSTVTGTNPTISISGGTIIGEREAIEADFADKVYIDLSGTPDISGELFIYNKEMPNAVFRLNNGFEPVQDVHVVLNSEPSSDYVPVDVTSGAESELEHVTIEWSNKVYIPVFKDGAITIVECVTIIFKNAILGDELISLDVLPGTGIPYDDIKDKIKVEDRDGYYYRWVDSTTNKVIDLQTYTVPEDANGQIIIYPYYYLETPEVSVGADRIEATIGESITITASVTNYSDVLVYSYAWFVDGHPLQVDKTSASITVMETGSYSVVVTVTDGKKTLDSEPSEAVSVSFTEESTEPDQPFIPFPDDDYVPLPPQIVYDDDDGSDDSVKIAACAAAAIIAVILAIVLATTYRRR